MLQSTFLPVEPRPPSSILRQRFAVQYDYAVAFTRGCFDADNNVLAEILGCGGVAPRPRCVVFLDQGVVDGRPDLPATIRGCFSARGDLPALAMPPLALPGGEAVKKDGGAVSRLQDIILDKGIDRHSYVIAVGGGAFLDAVGLAASTAHRGVRLVRVPTTVLAQDDSGVGVKSAVNRRGFKNQIGTFAVPWAVVNDADFIDTLPPRERVAGMAEAVKVALIRDASFFAWLECHAERLASFDADAMQTLIRRCAELHMRQIAQGGDPFEQGSARPLDFGHWSAHKLEALSDNDLRHGEAVAIGIALDTRYSVLAGLLTPGTETRVAALLERLGFGLWHAAMAMRDSDGRPLLLRGLREFQEHLGGKLTITLLAGIGWGVEVNHIDERLVANAIGWLAARRAA